MEQFCHKIFRLKTFKTYVIINLRFCAKVSCVIDIKRFQEVLRIKCNTLNALIRYDGLDVINFFLWTLSIIKLVVNSIFNILISAGWFSKSISCMYVRVSNEM